MSDLFANKNKSLIKMFKSNGPNIEHLTNPSNDFVPETEIIANFRYLVPVCKIASNKWNRIFLETINIQFRPKKKVSKAFDMFIISAPILFPQFNFDLQISIIF